MEGSGAGSIMCVRGAMVFTIHRGPMDVRQILARSLKESDTNSRERRGCGLVERAKLPTFPRHLYLPRYDTNILRHDEALPSLYNTTVFVLNHYAPDPIFRLSRVVPPDRRALITALDVPFEIIERRTSAPGFNEQWD